MHFVDRELHFTSNRKKVEFNFVIVLSIAGIFILTFFNSWNWFLILRGLTTIEFWMSSVKLSKNKTTVINDYSLGLKNNFYQVFGTHSKWKALFIPDIKKLPYSGLEWSKIIYYFVNFKGIKEQNDYHALNAEDTQMEK